MIQLSVASDSRPGRIQVTSAGLLILVVLFAVLVAVPYGAMQLPEVIGFVPAFGSLTAFAVLFTTLVLFGHACATRSRADMHLAAAYLFSSLVIVPYLFASPGVVTADALIGADGAADWLWCAWHGGFAALVAVFAVVAKHDRAPHAGGARLARCVVLCAAVAVALGILGAAHLPPVRNGSSYGEFVRRGIGPAVLACTVFATILVAIRLRARDTIALWLAVAMVAGCLDVWLGLAGGARFTFGWYLGRALSLMSNFTVFVALLFESMRLYGHASRMNQHLEHLSLTDQLTQAPNRRAFDGRLAVEWRRAGREMLPISLLMIDVDQFKSFNDSFGHPAGDRCLRLVAETLQATIRRPLDMAARLGGEEFVLLLPNTEACGAAVMGERVRAAVEALNIANPGSSRGIVTVSVGVATGYPRYGAGGPSMLIDRADAGLYAAKRGGRNDVRCTELDADAAELDNVMA